MNKINLEQGSDDWLLWRKSHVTASEAPIIMGESKYMNEAELLMEKLGKAPPKPVNSFITGLGHRFEPQARAYINLLLDKEYEPVVATHHEFPWLSASFDGLDGNHPLEIKYVGAKKLQDVKCDVFDRSHWIQAQHQMIVSGSNTCLYCCYTLADYRSIDQIEYREINFDQEYVENKLWPKLNSFWEKLNESLCESKKSD